MMILEKKLHIAYEMNDSRWSCYAFDQLERLIYKILDAIMTQEASFKIFVQMVDQLHLSLVFTDNAHIRQLNSDFRGKDRPTNVLSFPASEYYEEKTSRFLKDTYLPVQNLGDIVFGFETIMQEALDEGKTKEAHFTHLLTHALLHLIGYDHLDQVSAEKMAEMEVDILAGLGVSNPYEQENLEGLSRDKDA